MQSTEWRPVVGYEGSYEVSDDGQIRSVDRIVRKKDGTSQKYRGRIRLPHDNGHGYLQVSLYLSSKGRQIKAHRAVAEAFIGPGAPGQEVRHLDGNRRNNAASNLAWGTRAENMQDAVRHGTLFARFRGVTHCIRGHELSGENVYLHGHTRHCRTCKADRQRASRSEALLHAGSGNT